MLAEFGYVLCLTAWSSSWYSISGNMLYGRTVHYICKRHIFSQSKASKTMSRLIHQKFQQLY